VVISAVSVQLETVLQRSAGPPHAAQDRSAALLEAGSELLTHTAEQTRQLHLVEATVRGAPRGSSPERRLDVDRLPAGAEPHISG